MSLWKTEDKPENKPKFILDADKDDVYGIDVNEAESNRSKGNNTPGWVKHVTYTNESGVTRTKTEVLVAARSMSTEFDEDDFQNFVIKLKKLPKTLVVEHEDTAELKVEASTKPAVDGVTFAYQWQELVDDEWEDIASETTDTLEFIWDEGLIETTQTVRCVVSADDTADVISNVTVVSFEAAPEVVEPDPEP